MNDLIYDWNATPQTAEAGPTRVLVQDATLSEATRDPGGGPLGFEDARSLVEQSIRLETDSIDLGWVLESSGLEQVGHLLQGFRGRRAACSMRAEPNILKALAQISHDSEVPLEVLIADPLKGYNPSAALNCCRRAGELGLRPVLTLVGTELLEPWRLDNLLTAAAHADCVGLHIFDSTDTMSVAGVGHLVRFAREHFATRAMPLWVAFSGSNARGLALAKALEAVEAGAQLIRASALGLGRNGYTPLELLLVNLRLNLRWGEPLRELTRYLQLASDKLGYSVPGDYPVFGTDAFRTASGAHAAAVTQAPDSSIADLVYCSVPASWVGARQHIEIGPMSGQSNVAQWLARQNRDSTDPAMVDKILTAARSCDRILNELEIFELMRN